MSHKPKQSDSSTRGARALSPFFDKLSKASLISRIGVAGVVHDSALNLSYTKSILQDRSLLMNFACWLYGSAHAMLSLAVFSAFLSIFLAVPLPTWLHAALAFSVLLMLFFSIFLGFAKQRASYLIPVIAKTEFVHNPIYELINFDASSMQWSYSPLVIFSGMHTVYLDENKADPVRFLMVIEGIAQFYGVTPKTLSSLGRKSYTLDEEILSEDAL